MLEREDDIQGVVDGLATALGIDEIPGDQYHRRTEPGCAATLGIPEDEAWYERNTFAVPPPGNALARIYPATVDYLTGAGFAVDELVAPLSATQGLRAVRDDLTVLIDFGVGPDAGANLTVTAGPCAVALSPVAERYEVLAG